MAGTQALEPLPGAFPGTLAQSWIRSRTARPVLIWDAGATGNLLT